MMAGTLCQDFIYSSMREPVEFSCPLWKLQIERQNEYDELLRLLTICKADFNKLLKAEVSF